jgi:hypothetical protein
LLVIVDPPGDGFFGGKIVGDNEFGALDSFEEGGAHFIFFGVIEEDGDEIEGHDLVEFFGENAEEFFWVAIDTDGLGDAEERFQARREGLLECGMRCFGHAFFYVEVFHLNWPQCLTTISTVANRPPVQQDFRSTMGAGPKCARNERLFDAGEGGIGQVGKWGRI